MEEKMKEPRRPLSAYNLFYRFKREKMLAAQRDSGGRGGASGRADLERLLRAPPGLEDGDCADGDATRRREAIRAALRGNLFPADTAGRVHRKTSHGVGGLGFVDLNQIMCASWKAIDRDARRVFEELAEDGRAMHRQRSAEYRKRHPTPAPRAPKPPAKSSPKKRKATGRAAAADAPSRRSPGPVVGSEGATSTSGVAPAQRSPRATPATAPEAAGGRPAAAPSAYRLFCRFKRAEILAAQRRGPGFSRDDAARLIAAPPGRDAADVRAALRGALPPCDVPGLSHAEATRRMADSWRSLDGTGARAVFREIAEDLAARSGATTPHPGPAAARRRASIRSCLERIAGQHPPGALDPIDVLPGDDEVVSRARQTCAWDAVPHKSEVSADDFMKLISILDDNLCA